MEHTDLPSCVGTWTSNVSSNTTQTFKGILIKTKFTFFFFKSVVGSEKEKQNILKDLDSAPTNNGFPYATQKLNLQEAVYCPQLWQSYLPRLSGRSKLSMKEIRCFIKKA